MSDLAQYEFWRRRLAGEVLPIFDGEPQAGFYRLKTRNGEWQPVAYWYGNDGSLRCRVGKYDIEEQVAMERWPYASKHPIEHEVYKAVVDGAPWPDQHEAVTRDRRNSNGAPDEDSFDGLKDRIEDLARDADALIKIGAAADQSAADRASDLANRLGELQKKADAVRAEEKKPHDDAAKAVQVKWKPLLERADVYREIKLRVITPFLQLEAKRQREAEEAARAAAREAAQTGAAIPGIPASRPAPKAGSGGRRSVALRSVKVVTITDRAALLAFFANSQQITELLQDMAEKAVRAGAEVPGVTVTEEQRAA